MAVIAFLARAGAGFKTLYAVATGGVAASANSVIQTGSDGFMDDSFIHPSLVPAPISLPAAVAIPAGKQVNIFNNNGTESVQLADATTNPPLRADGFVLTAAQANSPAKVYRRGGANTALSGMTLDLDYFLGAAGGITSTQNTTPGQLDQYIGKATATTLLDQPAPQQGVLN